MTSFAIEPIYGSLLLATLSSAAMIAVISLVTPPTQNPNHRRWLLGLRWLAAIVLLLALFRPAFLRTDNRLTEAALIVAADTSRSMTLPDGDGQSRWETQAETWAKLSRAIMGMDETLGLRLVAYDQTAQRIANATPEALENESPEGELTDLSAAALSAIQAAEGQPIAGVVLMGDGTQTAPVRGTGAQRVIETLDSLGVPLWSVPIGPAGGASASRDVSVDALAESFQMFAGNEVDVDFQVLTRGLVGVEIPVRLSWLDTEGNVTEFATRNVVSDKASDVTAVTVPVRAPAPGTYRLRVEADTQDGELVSTNNTQVAFVDVREGGGRILYLEGSPRLEQTFLRRSLRRFPDLDLTFRWIPIDTRDRWPIDLADAFEPGKYDIYILGDLDATALGNQQLNQLAETVGDGAGLVMLGGYHSFGSGGYADSPLERVLPVELDRSQRRTVGDVEQETGDQIEGPLAVKLARQHPILEMGGDDPATLWPTLTPLLGANRLSGPKVAPGVQVLLETEQNQPLLVIGGYGRGRTAAVAMDSTWRWWRGGNNEIHRRFWRQLVRWVLGREETNSQLIQVEMDARRFSSANLPSFQAGVQVMSNGSAAGLTLMAEIIDESGNTKPVTSSAQSTSEGTGLSTNASIRGTIPKLPPGFYRLRVRPEPSSEALPATEMAFQVIDESRELALPMADPVYLQQLAELTVNHGGGAFTPDEIDQLIETIQQRRQRAETPVVEKHRLGDGPFSGWMLFLLFAGALSTEWYLRRQWGLA
ncbi:MAG: glutamine amidotransferase [Planctomycetota bacterium]|nr:glutamine amidotransferase [Planctomycetota bacterium]